LDSKNKISGSSSSLKHHYLDQEIKLYQITIDSLLKKNKISHVDFLKLDIEGLEYDAIIGAKDSLKNKVIDYIQLEYAQTWIETRGRIKKILELCNYYGYILFRIRKNDLLAIPKYHFAIEDFCYSSMLMVRKGCKPPLYCKKSVMPDM
jgi:hypothetical protein